MINENNFIQESGVCGIQSETLHLTESALNHPEYKNILDLGTGTGYIGIVLASKGFNVDAVDNSDKAIDNSRKNAIKFKSAVNIYKSDLFDNIKHTYDLIIFNPPVNPNENKYTKYISSFLRKVSLFRLILIPIIRLKYMEARKNFIVYFLKRASDFLNENGVVMMHLTKDDIKWLSLNEYAYLEYSIDKKISADDFIVIFKDLNG